MFFLSIIFIKLSDKCKHNKYVKIIFLIVALLLPCIMAGLRAIDIGTDVKVYLRPMYECAHSANSFNEYLQLKVNKTRVVGNFEIGFTALIFLVTKLFNNFQAVMFFVELMIIIPIYLGIKKANYSKENSIWLEILSFYFMFYNTTLNLMRQFIGLSWLFLGTIILFSNDKKKNLKFLIILILACLFHKASILSLIIYAFYNILKINKMIKLGNIIISLKKLLMIVVCCVGIGIMLNADILVNLLELFGMDYYSTYISGSIKLYISTFIKNAPLILIILATRKSFLKDIKNSYIFLAIFIYSIIIDQFTTVNVYAARIAFTFSIFNCLFFPTILKSKNCRKNYILKIVYVFYLLGFWYYYFVYCGGNETIPYKFYFL